MGFTRNTAVTTHTGNDSDFKKYGFEQELANVERGTDDLVNLQKAAVNVIIKDLKAQAVTPADVTNTDDFHMEIIYWCLMTLYAGENPSAMPGQSKHSHYMKMWQAERASRIIELVDGTTITPNSKGVPKVSNHDAGAFFKTMDNEGENLEEDLGSTFDDHVDNRKNPRDATGNGWPSG